MAQSTPAVTQKTKFNSLSVIHHSFKALQKINTFMIHLSHSYIQKVKDVEQLKAISFIHAVMQTHLGGVPKQHILIQNQSLGVRWRKNKSHILI
jgi:hypothetical protein